jgi:hypothetical protein
MLGRLSLFFTALTFTAVAQIQYGTIRGLVTDVTGSVVVGAAVKATNQETGTGFATTSNESGQYTVGGLLPGAYSITVEMRGFKKFTQTDVSLTGGSVARVDARMDLGDVAETIKVSAAGAVINTETANVVAQAPRELVDEPVTLRRLEWAPSETVGPFLTGQSYSGGTAIIAYGSRSYDRKVTLDGAQTNISGLRLPRDSVESIEAFSLNSPAEYQTTNTFKVNTSRGTNDIHGEVWAQLQNNALNALAWYATGAPRPPGTPTTYRGFSAGGPVWIPKVYNGKNRSFFFVAFQQLPSVQSGQQLRTTPTAAMVSGDLSPLDVTIKNPFTGQPFQNNTIPSNLLSPIAQRILSTYYPLPASPVFKGNNYFESGSWTSGAHDILVRGDQQIGNKNSVSVTVGRTSTSTTQPQGFSASTNTFISTGTYTSIQPIWYLNISDAHIFSPSLLNQFNFGTQHSESSLTLSAMGKAIASQIGLPLGPDSPDNSGGPSFTISDMTGASFLSPSASSNTVYSIRDNVSWTKRIFTSHFGVEVIRPLSGSTVYGNPFGTYNFTGQFTGSGFGDFLLGLPSTTARSLPLGATNLYSNQWGAYFQEDIHATARLTVNVGLRYQRNNPTSANNNKIYNFDVATGNLVIPNQSAMSLLNPGLSSSILARIVTAQTAGFPETLVHPIAGFSPRLGVAYKLRDNTVLRVGYGMFDSLSSMSAFTGGPFQPGSQNFTNALNCSSPGTCAPVFDLSNPFPSSAGGFNAVSGLGVSGVNPNLKRPTTQQWNATVEQVLPGKISMRVSYDGSKATQLAYRRNVDLPPASVIPFAQNRLVYPQWSSAIYGDSGGNLTYHALDIEWKRAFLNGIYFDVNYLWEKQLTDVDEDGTMLGWGSQGLYGTLIENPYNRARDKGNAHSIPRQRLRGTFLFELPLGKGKPLLSHVPGIGGSVVNTMLGGWSFSGNLTRFTGWWYSPFWSGFDAANTGQFLIRADRIGSGVPQPSQTADNIFNAGDFTRPLAGQYGTSGARILQGLPGFTVDGTLWKEVSLLPRMERSPKLRVGALASNLLNHPDKSVYSTSPLTINAPSSVARANDYYYTSVINGGLGSWRIIRFEIALRF